MKQLPTVTWEVHVLVDWIEADRWTVDRCGTDEQLARESYDYLRSHGRRCELVRVTSVREVVE